MRHDLPVLFSDQGEAGFACRPQQLHEPGLVRPMKRLLMHMTNQSDIFGLLAANLNHFSAPWRARVLPAVQRSAARRAMQTAPQASTCPSRRMIWPIYCEIFQPHLGGAQRTFRRRPQLVRKVRDALYRNVPVRKEA